MTAGALGVQFFRLAELPTLLALRHRSSLFLDLKKRSVCVMAGRRSVSFDARFTVKCRTFIVILDKEMKFKYQANFLLFT